MNRLKNIDILKIIGLLCIILAHVEPNGIIFQLRNFDVVLMIMISSYLFIINNDKNKSKIDCKYLIKRIKRLLIPTWIFLVIFFIISKTFTNYSLKAIIHSFLLHEGIGYVWVIRIYLMVAVLLPILVPMLKKKYSYLVIIILYIIYEISAQIGIFNINIIMADIIAYIIPTILIIAVTYWVSNNKEKKIVIFSLINFLIFILCGLIIYKLTGKIENTNYMKYPFRIYYLSYAFFISTILILITRIKVVTDLLYNKFVEIISKSSLWIYLWHILFVILIKTVYPNLNWIIKYICVLGLSISITYIQNKMLDIFEKKKNINKEIFSIFRG